MEAEVSAPESAHPLTVQPAPAAGLVMATPERDFFGTPKRCVTSLNAQDRKQAKLMILAEGPEVPTLKLAIGSTISMVHIHGFEAEYLDNETGELSNGRKLVLIDDQGFAVGTWSPTVINQVRSIIARIGPPPWNPPIRVKVKQLPAAPPHTKLALELVLDEDDKPAGKKGR